MAKNKQNSKITQPPVKPPAANKPAAKPVKTARVENPEKWFIIILIAVAFIINARTIAYNYTYDDAVFTSENSYIGIKGIEAIPGLFTHAKNYNFDKSNTGQYRPLLPITFAVEHEVFGFKPAISHFINLVLFCLLIWVMFKLLRRMFPTYSIYIPFFIMLLYELHPIHTEVVASVKSRDEIMSLLLTVIAVLQSFRYVDDNKVKHLIISGVLFFVAMLTKESVTPFIGIVPLTLYFFTNAKPSKLLISAIPYVIATAIFVILGAVFLDKLTTNTHVAITENTFTGVKNFSEKLGTVLVVQLLFLRLLVFPHPLSFDYGYNQIPIVPVTNYVSLISLAVFVALIAYSIINFKKKDIYAYCIIFYLMAVSITANLFIEIGATAGERFLFISSLGFCMAVVFLLAKLFKTDISTVTYKNAPNFAYVILGISLLYSVKTVSRNEDWRNNLALFSSGVEVCPNSWRAQHCIGEELKLKILAADTPPELKKQYTAEAIDHFNKAIAIYADKADTHGDLGAIYFTDKQYDSAEVHLKRALELNPKLSAAAANLGTVYLTETKYSDALKYYLQADYVDPSNITAVFNTGVCFVQFKQYDSAVFYFKKSVAIAPDYYNHKGMEYIAIVYKMMGRMDSAVKYMGLAKVNNPAFTL
jgi:protein O-mannosyl-transferase